MDNDIYDNQEIENEEYNQGNYHKNSNSREEDENNNNILINKDQISGEESNKGEVFKNQNVNDINELDVSLNDNNNEYNLENIDNEDERIDDMNNDMDNNINEENEEAINNIENNIINNNNINMGYGDNYINNDLNNNFMDERKEDNNEENIKGENYDEYYYNNNNNEDVNNMNINNNAFEENEENINNDNINIFRNTINNLENLDSMNYNNNINNNNMNYYNNINNYYNRNNMNLNMNNYESIENDLNYMNNNNINLNEDYFKNEGLEVNENEINELNIINNIRDINIKIVGIEKKFKKVEEENKNLKQQLEYETIENRNIASNKVQIYENCLKQGKLLMDDFKNKNAKLYSKINDLESKNDSLNYQLIEANKRIKQLEDELKKNINDNNDHNDNRKNKDNNVLNEVEVLKKKVYDNEVIISKLNYDKRKLEEKIENINFEYKKKMSSMINYKNSEINILKKCLKDYEEYLKNNNINENMNSINNIDFNRNENLNEDELRLELANKDKIIKGLNLKLNMFINKFKNTLEISELSHENIGKLEKQIHKLVNDKKKLCKIIEETKRANSQINNEKFVNMQNKLSEYKYKIVILKKKIVELHDIIQKNRNYNSYNNISLFSPGQKLFNMYNTANNFYNPSY